MFLQITDADGGVKHIDLGSGEGEWVLGRSENCDITLPGSSVSRKHARLFGGPDTYFIADLGAPSERPIRTAPSRPPRSSVRATPSPSVLSGSA